MKEKPVKIILPKDPYQIGTMPDGKPIWVDPKDFIQTPDEKLEQKDNMATARFQGAVLKIANAVLENAGRLLFETMDRIIPETAMESDKTVADWIVANDFYGKQEGLTTIIKLRGKVIRTMTAGVDKRFADAVAKRVMKLIKDANTSPQSN